MFDDHIILHMQLLTYKIAYFDKIAFEPEI